jgi:hypothetical protein
MIIQVGLPAARDVRPVGRQRRCLSSIVLSKELPLISGQVNVQSDVWSGTEFNSNNAWNFNFNNGNQNNNNKNNNLSAWAVRSGE